MLPFHRRDKRREVRANETHAAANEGKGKRLGRFLVRWVKVSWKDVIAMAVLGGAGLGIYMAPLPTVRTFPVTFDASGDVVYPEIAYPYRGWIISPALSGVLSALVPIVIILLAQIRIRSFWDANNAILGVLYSLIMGNLFQVIVKNLIGGFRPYFLDVCQPDISLAATRNSTGLNGVGFRQIYYTTDICTNQDATDLKNAMTSFPSGHATGAFAGYIFLFLWMNAKLKVWANFQTSFYWLGLLFAPILGAVLIACSLTIDQAHNWYDILAGSTIGTVMALASYRVLYASIWDWRYNHIPLTRGRVFDYYVSGLGPEHTERAVFARKNGWGRRRRDRVVGEKRASRGIGSARSSATYARGGNAVSPHGNGVRMPETTRVRSQQNGRVADDMV